MKNETTVFDNASELIESLSLICDIAKTQKNIITLDELKRYLGADEIPDKYMREIYAYLGSYGISVEGYSFVPVKSDESTVNDEDQDDDINNEDEKKENDNVAEDYDAKGDGKSDDSVSDKEPDGLDDTYDSENKGNAKIVLDSLREQSGKKSVDAVKWEHEEALVEAILKEEDAYINTYIEKKLSHVKKIANDYKKSGVFFDDVVAEGNLSLVLAVNELFKYEKEKLDAMFFNEGEYDLELLHLYIMNRVRIDIEKMIFSESDVKEKQEAVASKYNLIKKAEEFLLSKNGRKPTDVELSDYTGVDVEEIKYIRKDSEAIKNLNNQKGQ